MDYTATPDPLIQSTATWRNGGQVNRPAALGTVDMQTESLTPAPPPGMAHGPRTVSVEGVVWTGGGAVGPHIGTPSPAVGWNTVGQAGIDKGHVFALSLGGPQLATNITPQWAKWQQHGTWRNVERHINALAVSLTPGNPNAPLWMPYGGVPIGATHIKFEIELEYSKSIFNIYPRLNVWGFPKTWIATAYPSNAAGAMQGINYIYNKYRVPNAVPNAWHNAVT